VRRIERGTTATLDPVTRMSRPICNQFARLLPGDTACASYAGILVLNLLRGGGR
jgi:hypothetical protein